MRRKCLVKHIIEGKIEKGIKLKGRRRRRHKKLPMTLRKGGVYKIERRGIVPHWVEKFLCQGYGFVIRETKE